MSSKRLGYRTLHSMIWSYIGKFIEFILAFIFSTIAARAVGPSLYGSYNLLVNIIATFIIFSSFGQEAILNKYIPQLNAVGRSDSARALFRSIFLSRIVFFLTIGIIFWIFNSFLSSFFSDYNISNFLLIFVLLFLAKGIQGLFASFLNAMLKLKESVLVLTFSQALGLIVMLFLIWKNGPSLAAVLEAVLFSTVMSVFIFLFFSFNSLIGKNNLLLSFSRQYFSFGLSVWQISMLTYTISATLNILLMGKILKDPQQIGFYSTAVLFSYLPGNLIGSWAGIILPSMAEVKAKYGYEGVSRAFVIFSKIILVLLVPFLIFLGWYARPMVLSLFGEKFMPAVTLLQIFVCLSLTTALAMPHVGFNTLYAIDQEKLVLKFRFLAGLINIALVFLLTSTYKATGVMIAGLIAVIFQTFAEFLAVKKRIEFKYPYLYLMKVFFTAILGILIVSLFPVNSITTIILAGLFYGLILLVIFHYARILSIQDKEFLSSLHPILVTITKYF